MKKPATQEQRATKAFLSSGGGDVFRGAKLAPFTAQRMAVAIEMGFSVAVSYRRQNLFRDVIILIWLRLQPQARIDAAEFDAVAAMKAAYEWAEKENLTILSESYKEGMRILSAMIDQLKESRAQPVAKHKGGDVDEPGEL